MAGPERETILVDRQELLGYRRTIRDKDARIRELEGENHRDRMRADRAEKKAGRLGKKLRESETRRRAEERRRRRAERKSKKLEKTAEDLTRAIARCRKSSRTITSKNKKLTSMIKARDNSHTPPSMRGSNLRVMKKRRAARNGPARPRGGQPGHRGTTNKPKPTRIEQHTSERCSCGSTSIEHVGTVHHTCQHMVPAVVETVRHDIYEYECKKCDRTFEADHDLPTRGEYDRNIQAAIIAAFLARMPYRLIARFLSRMGVMISFSTVYAILKHAGTALAGSSQEILEKIRKADVLHGDETSMHLNGKTVWVWVLHDPETLATYYAIRPSRGRDVLNELLPGWKGVMVCDGWRAYAMFTIQRCWAHILREADNIQEKHEGNDHASGMKTGLHRIYDDARAASKLRTLRERRAAEERLRRRLDALIKKHRRSHVLRGFTTTLRNAAKNLFRFVVDPRIPPTNNDAERALREIVVHRKVRGGIRSEETMSWMANLFSCAETWKAQKLDVVAEAANYV